MSAAADPQEILERVFGYESFRGEQRRIIEHVIAGGDALVLMPTGGGKSLCYQIPALAREGVGIVVSPLIALMRDQVDALREAGVEAAFLNSSLAPDEARRAASQSVFTAQCLGLDPSTAQHSASAAARSAVRSMLFLDGNRTALTR